MPLALDRQHATDFLSDRDALDGRVAESHRRVVAGETASPEMLGWRQMLLEPDDALLESVAETAAEIRDRADVLLCIGIGGSYLGAEAVMQALVTPFSSDGPEILFAGHHLGPDYHERLIQYLDGEIVERALLGVGRGDDPAVGGRFSVLTPVGLLPIAAAGVDVRSLYYGAVAGARAVTDADPSHPALQYAGDRFAFHEAGYKTEVMAVMDPALKGIGAWWQQLFGESEGKEGKGLFPVVLQYTTDLHSVGQYVQQGQRTLVETFLRIDDSDAGLAVREEDGDPDGLNYLAGKRYGEINEKAYQATAEAHAEGGVPNWTVTLPRLDAETVGHLIHFYEHAVAVGGTLLGVDPFNQPGVEDYKQKMFSLLGRPR
jgi:glucose-6-phosphate isomerase